LTRAVPKGMNRTDFVFLYPMLNIGSLVIAGFAGWVCVVWACLNYRDPA
jgi:hypothetical protein